MAVYSLTGNDTLIINDRVLNNLSDGSTIELAFDNDIIGTSTGKNDNTIIADDRQGSNATLTLRIIRGSENDRWLNGLLIQQRRDLPTFALMNGSFTKRIGDGTGNVKFDNYVLLGGAFKKGVDGSENNNGDTEQGTSVYTIFFSRAQRALG